MREIIFERVNHWLKWHGYNIDTYRFPDKGKMERFAGLNNDYRKLDDENLIVWFEVFIKRAYSQR